MNKSIKLSDLFQGFLDNCYQKGLRESTIYGHRNQIKNIIGPILGSFKLSSIYPIHRDLVIEKANTMGKSSANHSVITLRRILDFAKKCGHKLNFDLDDVEVPVYKRTKKPQALDLLDLKALRRAFDTDKFLISRHALSERHRRQHELASARTHCLLELMIHTGLRLSEALSVNIEDIDFVRKELQIENVKTGDWETVYLFGCENAMHQYLNVRDDDHPALFVSNSGIRLGYNTAQTTIKRLKRRLGDKLPRKNITHHTCRKTFVTSLLRKKVDPKQTQLLARHKSLRTTLDYYYEVELEQLKPIHEKIMSQL